MARRVITRAPVRAPRRKTTWGAINSLDTTSIAVSTNVLVGSFSAAGLANLGPSTLIRVRGLIDIRSDQNAASEKATGAMGISVVTETARALGVTALQGPGSEAASDAWQTWQGIVAPPTTGASGSTLTVQYMIDSKAMRKLGDLDSIVLLVENLSAANVFEVMVQL